MLRHYSGVIWDTGAYDRSQDLKAHFSRGRLLYLKMMTHKVAIEFLHSGHVCHKAAPNVALIMFVWKHFFEKFWEAITLAVMPIF